MNALVTVIVGVGVLIFLGLIWRFLSTRCSLPCPVWLGWMVERDNPFCRINRAQVIIEHLHVESGMKVLDAGCGPGRLTIPLAHKVGLNGLVVAMDIQAGMLERVREKVKSENLNNVQFILAGLGDNKLEHTQFDRAILVTVLGEIPNQKAALTEIYHALKLGGILSITELIFDPHFQRQSVVRKLAREIGFKEQQLFGSRIAYTINFVKT